MGGYFLTSKKKQSPLRNLLESFRLHVGDVVSVVAEQSRHTGFTDLVELIWNKFYES